MDGPRGAEPGAGRDWRDQSTRTVSAMQGVAHLVRVARRLVVMGKRNQAADDAHDGEGLDLQVGSLPARPRHGSFSSRPTHLHETCQAHGPVRSYDLCLSVQAHKHRNHRTAPQPPMRRVTASKVDADEE